MTNSVYLLQRGAAALLCLALCAFAGCGPDELKSPTAVKLQAIGKLYLDCAIAWDNTGPASEQAFKKHLRGLPDHVLSSNGMDPKAVDAFVSGRDNEPFVILYGVKITAISGKEAPLVAHEKTGKNGRFLVGFANGAVQEVDAAGLEELKAAKQ